MLLAYILDRQLEYIPAVGVVTVCAAPSLSAEGCRHLLVIHVVVYVVGR